MDQLQHLTIALADRYRVLRELGRGGMATVYLADDPKHRRQVAIKVFGPLARAWDRKLEGKVGDPELRAEIDSLQDQLAEMDGLSSRVQELEERVEFAERMLSQKRDEDLLQRGGGL